MAYDPINPSKGHIYSVHFMTGYASIVYRGKSAAEASQRALDYYKTYWTSAGI